MSESLQSILYLLASIAIPSVSFFLIFYLKKNAKRIDEETKSWVMHDSIAASVDLIQQIVTSVSQLYVDAYKAEGKFDEDAQKFVFNEAKNKVMSLLTTESKDVIEAMYSDLGEWVNVQIEAAVKNQKNQ